MFVPIWFYTITLINECLFSLPNVPFFLFYFIQVKDNTKRHRTVSSSKLKAVLQSDGSDVQVETRFIVVLNHTHVHIEDPDGSLVSVWALKLWIHLLFRFPPLFFSSVILKLQSSVLPVFLLDACYSFACNTPPRVISGSYLAVSKGVSAGFAMLSLAAGGPACLT